MGPQGFAGAGVSSSAGGHGLRCCHPHTNAQACPYPHPHGRPHGYARADTYSNAYPGTGRDPTANTHAYPHGGSGHSHPQACADGHSRTPSDAVRRRP
ncbi:MAG: hypothetical protein ACE5IG_02415 [Dehalococcoidia bacterium]